MAMFTELIKKREELIELIKKREELISGKNISEIEFPNARRRAIAEYIYAMTKTRQEEFNCGITNKEHHDLMVKGATELNVHFDEVAVACAEWSHEFDYTPAMF